MACCSSGSRSGEMRNGFDQKEGRGKSAPVIRCAIYTRKSTEEGLDQEFNSLDAQRESAEAYISSQKEAGWKLVPDRYELVLPRVRPRCRHARCRPARVLVRGGAAPA